VRGSAAFRLSTTPGGVLTFPVRDPDARDYIRRVAAADGQPLEPLVQRAIDAFVRGCKADGIWDAIKASCILAGARTLAGALVPLVGAAPANYNFVAGDYNRETGLVGDGSTKYLDANRNQDADPQDNHHMSTWLSSQISGIVMASSPIGASTPTDLLAVGAPSTTYRFRSRFTSQTQTPLDFGDTSILGFIGISRPTGAGFTARTGNLNTAITADSSAIGAYSIHLFGRPFTASTVRSSSRLAFYSIGEALDLALLDARVTTLINAIGAAL
jgi:hypothetical protein